MGGLSLFSFAILVSIPLCYGDNIRSINFEDLEARENETRTSVDFVPLDLLKQSNPYNLTVLPCGNDTVNIFDGSAFIIESENFPNKAPADTNCSFNVQVQPGVALDLMCEKIHLPCKKNNFLDITSSVTEKKASFCTTKGVQKNVRISIAIQDEPMDLVFSHRIEGKKVGKGFSCMVRGLGGEQEEGDEEHLDVNTEPDNSTTSEVEGGVQSRSLADCGRTRYVRIVNGGWASNQEYPWAVHLILNGGFCGGSLINNWWILTAAHCSFRVPVRTITAFLGCRGRFCGTARRSISRNIIHPDYRFPLNDISLLKMTSPITSFSNTIRNVCLSYTVLSPNSYVAVSGWGRVSGGGSLAPILKEALLAIISDATCRMPTPILCTRAVTGNVCRGDSGSPVVYIKRRGNTRRYVQNGIASFVTSRTCDPRFYSGHTEVPYYVNWIRGIAGSVGLF